MKTIIAHKSIYISLIIILCIGLVSCKKKDHDADVPNPPLGCWTRTYSGTESYHAQLNLQETGIFEWIMLDTLSTHTNSFAKIQVNGDQLRIYDDPDFTGDGIYKWSFSDDILTLTVVSDNYSARVSALSGDWNIKNPVIPQNLCGSWQKSVVEQGISYRVNLVLTPEGVLKWIMVDPIPGHTNSTVPFAATDNIITIYNDPDCNGNGYFNYVLQNNTLTCTYLKDQCPPRSQSFSGIWSKIE